MIIYVLHKSHNSLSQDFKYFHIEDALRCHAGQEKTIDMDEKTNRVIDQSVSTGWRLQSICIHIMLGNNLAKNIMSENKQRESAKISIFLVV